MIKSILLGMTTFLVATPAMAHPRHPKFHHVYSYPEKDVMIRKDWKRCKKIKYVTKYDKWGWYTERKVLPLKSCWSGKGHNHGNPEVKIKMIFKD